LVHLKGLRIVKVEDRSRDAWVDMSLRQLREGEVRFYKVNDTLTGEWLFKVCPDAEMARTIVKAIKCPPGRGFAQLEGSTMLFQRSVLENQYYDVVSLSYLDENGRLRRNIVGDINEVPNFMKENFRVIPYEEATGKKAPGKKLVSLCREGDEKAMITIFLLGRAWPISPVPPDLGTRTLDLLELIREAERAEIGEIYMMAKRRYKLADRDIEALIRLLEEKEKIERVGKNFIKTKW